MCESAISKVQTSDGSADCQNSPLGWFVSLRGLAREIIHNNAVTQNITATLSTVVAEMGQDFKLVTKIIGFSGFSGLRPLICLGLCTS